MEKPIRKAVIFSFVLVFDDEIVVFKKAATFINTPGRNKIEFCHIQCR